MAWEIQPQAMPGVPQYGSLGTRRRFPLVTKNKTSDVKGREKAASLAVRVTLNFEDPLKVGFSRSYEASQGFKATDRICQGLLHRLDHCSKELITRRDSGALASETTGSAEGKPLRFEISFRIDRAGTDRSITKTFKSYQKQPMTMNSARDTILAADRMIGLFLRRHDENFKWTDGPVQEHFSTRPNTFKHCIGSPVPTCCIPRSRFIEKTQQYEFIPGFEIELTFRSRCQRRKVPEWNKVVTVSSQQSTPMTLPVGEDALWSVSRALHHALDKRKMSFDSEHRGCARNDGPGACQHFEAGALDIGFRIRNHLGPEYDHLSQKIESKLALFCHPEALDCLDFARQIEHALVAARDEADEQLGQTDDLRLIIHELSGPEWTIRRPFTMSLDSSLVYSRRTIEAMLDRAQTGIADVLHGYDVSITLTAHKRGHLILDKTLIAHEIPDQTRQEHSEILPGGREWFIARLRERIQADIAMVIRDTCSLTEEADDQPKNLHLTEHVSQTSTAVPTNCEEMASTLPCQPVSDSVSIETKPTELDGTPVERAENVGLDETLCGGGAIETLVEASYSKDERLFETPAKAIRNYGDISFGETGGGRNGGLSMTDDEEFTPSSTPSLIESGAATPHDSLLATPSYLRIASGTLEPFSISLKLQGDEMPDNDIIDDSFHSDPPRAAKESSNYEPRRFSLLGKNIPKPSPTNAEPEAATMTDVEAVHEGWLEYCTEPVSDDEETTMVEEDDDQTITLNLDAYKQNQPVAPQMEGWLEYSVEVVDSDSEDEVPLECPIGNKEKAIFEPLNDEPMNIHTKDSDYFATPPEEPRLTPIEGSPRAPSFLILSIEESFPWMDRRQSILSDEFHTPGLVSKEETPEPGTPPLTHDPEDSDYSSLADPDRFPDLNTEVISHDGSMPLGLWSQTRPSYIPDDSDSEPETNGSSRGPRPRLVRPKTAMSFGRPNLHKRQFSSPTAGLLGLRDDQRVEFGLRNALVGSLSAALLQSGDAGRRQSRVLTSLKYEKGVIPMDRRRDSDSRARPGFGFYSSAQILHKA